MCVCVNYVILYMKHKFRQVCNMVNKVVNVARCRSLRDMPVVAQLFNLSHISLNQTDHYRFQRSSPLVLILSEINTFHYLPILFQIHFNNIIPSLLKSCKQFFSSSFPTETLRAFEFCPVHGTCHGHHMLLSLNILTIFDESQKLLSSLLPSFLQPLYPP